MRKILGLLLLASLAFTAYAGDKTTDIFKEDGTVRVECKASYKRNGMSTDDLANILTGISTIKGTQYYSQSKKEVTTLFTDAYTVEEPDYAKKTADKHLEAPLPQKLDIFGMLEDSRFGENVYQFSYIFDENHIILKITNIAPMRYSFLKAIDTNCFTCLLDIALTEDEIVVNNKGFCKPAVLPSFMESRINNAITNRMDALFGWFEKGITE